MTCSYDVLFHSTVNHDIYTDLLTRHVKGVSTQVQFYLHQFSVFYIGQTTSQIQMAHTEHASFLSLFQFHTTIKNTTYGAGYKVAVVGRNPIKGSLRSTALFTSITLPSCLNATNNNLTICRECIIQFFCLLCCYRARSCRKKN